MEWLAHSTVDTELIDRGTLGNANGNFVDWMRAIVDRLGGPKLDEFSRRLLSPYSYFPLAVYLSLPSVHYPLLTPLSLFISDC